MSLSSLLVSSVGPQIRRRGGTYFQRGRVALKTCGPGEATATVRGSRGYRVRLRRRETRIEATCTCPYFADRGEICKHVWATVLAVDAHRGLRRPDGSMPRVLAPANDVMGAVEVGGIGEAGEEPVQLRPLPSREAPHRPAATRASREPSWRQLVDAALRHSPPAPGFAGAAGSPGSIVELLYVIDVAGTLAQQELSLSILACRRRADGSPGKPSAVRLNRTLIDQLPDAADREIVALVAGARHDSYATWRYYDEAAEVPTRCSLPGPAADRLVPLLCATGRCRLCREPGEHPGEALAWDDGPPWELWLEVRETAAGAAGGDCRVTASLRRNGERTERMERMAIGEPALLLASGLVFAGAMAARLDAGGAFGWASLLREIGSLSVPAADREELVERLVTSLDLSRCRLELPESLAVERVLAAPRPRLRLLPPDTWEAFRDWPRAELSFRYEGREVAAGPPGSGLGGFYDRAARRLLLRDPAAEDRAAARLAALDLRATPDRGDGSPRWRVAPRQVPEVVRTLLAEEWMVEAHGRLYRSSSAFQISVTSGVDWFEVHGEAQFGGVSVRLPELLAALYRGEGFVLLGDGSLGLLPEEWLRRIAPVAGLGRPEGDHLRFHTAQASLLDALLAAEPEATCDEAFERARRRLAGFAGVAPAEAPAAFRGELRDYQRAGLGWLHFLRDFGFGGCLADDMGLGKTVQVLALLASRRERREDTGGADGGPPAPSLVVVPRSLLFNWLAEAARFAPGLAVLDFTGAGRRREGDDPFAGFDLVLTTYGTLRRNLAALRNTEFDYVVLDEAQAIKNADSQTAKAARLLRGRHRLALSGTPVENHLGELWSLLEFLNPGLLGSSSVLRAHAAELRDPRDPDAGARALLGRALRPFLLRRTKEQVAAELPAKVEQTLFCELPAKQRRLYDELRDHYRGALGSRIAESGLARTKIMVLEALLRLRQAACHPGLLDRERAGEPSAKLDVLLPQLREVLAEGHKALVFSQFTSFLTLLRRELDREGLPHLYLDGRTRDRREKVESFQSDPGRRLFLISLKAGGLGLNLTAADYVYLLDPWWNPAVEAQAIDRAHRIGQTRPVFAYRLVARDTVEEKILELQKSKRALADAILQADQSILASLSREDLELLLS